MKTDQVIHVFCLNFRRENLRGDYHGYVCKDSYVKAHQHSARAAGKKPQAIGKSRAGNTTKIHLVVDSYGLPIEFEITGGEVNDCSAAPGLIANKLPDAEVVLQTRATIASAYEST